MFAYLVSRYIYTVAIIFHVYMVLSGWVGVWSFFTKCPSLQLYEKLVLIALRLAVMGVHCVAAACFVLNILGGAPVPPCERVCHLYHQFMVIYRGVALPASMLVMIGSLLGLNLEQFALLLIHVPVEAIGLLWHVVICDAFLRGQPSNDVNEALGSSANSSSHGAIAQQGATASNKPGFKAKPHPAPASAGWAKAPPSPVKAGLAKPPMVSKESKDSTSKSSNAVPPGRITTDKQSASTPQGNDLAAGKPPANTSSKKSDAERNRNNSD